MNGTRRAAGRRRFGAVSLSLLVLGSAGAAGAAELPSLEVVRELRSARIAEERGDLAGAAAILETLLREKPGEPLPLARLVALRAHEGAGDALAELRERLTAQLSDSDLPIPSGTLRQLAREPGLEPEHLRAVAARLNERLSVGEATTNDELALRDSLDRLYRRLGDLEARRTNLDRVLELAPTFGSTWRALELDQALGHWDSALELVRPLAARPTATVPVLSTHLLLLVRTGAIERFEHALDDERYAFALSDPTRAVAIAWALEDAGQSESAKAQWERVLAADPEHEPARQALLYLHGSHEAQRAAQGPALEIGGDTEPEELLDRGTELLVAGDADGALPLLEAAAPAFPNSEMAWYNLGQAAFRLERWEVAAEAFGRAAVLNAERVESALNHGIALFELGRFAEAVSPLERTLALDPSRSSVHYYLAGCYSKLGRADDAMRSMKLYRASQDE